MWWRYFDRHDKTAEELCDDFDCLGELTRTDTPPRRIKQSSAWSTASIRIRTRSCVKARTAAVAGTELKCQITALDQENGLVEVKVGPGKTLPEQISLHPLRLHQCRADKAGSISLRAAWEKGKVLSQAVDDLLHRRLPRVTGHHGRRAAG